MVLGARDREGLLKLARASIRRAVGLQERLPTLGELDGSEELERPRGAFVTLKLPAEKPGGSETLRGCIGCVAGRRPLYLGVVELAPKAALEDPRFPPLSREELTRVRIEISVLTRPEPLERIDDLQLGRDGVQLRTGGATALFLPQVAPEHGWTRDVLLRQLARKAGLPDDGWKNGQLSTFRAEVFGEPRSD